ncbi:ATPase V1 complex subunit H [Dichotomocladium elegans]|nr:ATPase V1 complex subunit H [Dichotomocladium elegans]
MLKVSISNSYLEQIIVDIKETSVPWKEYERRGLITSDQIKLLNAIDGQPPDRVRSVLKNTGVAYISVVLHLLQSLLDPDALRYICVIADTLVSDEENTQYFHAMVKQGEQYPFGPFITILQTGDEKTALIASRPLVTLLCSTPDPASIDINPFCRWLSEKIGSRRLEHEDLAIQEAGALLQVREFRMTFWNTDNAVKGMVLDLTVPSVTQQMQYQIIFCLWLLTFEPEIAAKINHEYDLIPKLVAIAKGSFKEKVVRTSLATFRNLISKAPTENLAAMLVANLLPFTESLSSRKWTDPDITEDIEYLKEHLEQKFKSLSTFEKYASEIETGRLERSPPHESEAFWRDNVEKIESYDFQIIRKLAWIMSSSTDPKTLAIAISDIGHYVQYASKEGRRVLQEIGAKHRIMELMTHKNTDVRYQALSATQKFMHQLW